MIFAGEKTVKPVSSINGELKVPGDKSISHRAAMLSGLAQGESVIENFLTSEDCICTLKAMEAMGAKIRIDGKTIKVTGTASKLSKPRGPLDLGNSGTAIRLLSGLVAGQRFSAVLTGDESLCARPMKRIKDPLERMGAKIELSGEKGTPPIKMNGGNLKAIEYPLPVASAQVKSCILFAGLFAEGITTVIEPEPTRDHTERMFQSAGINVKVDGLKISVKGSSDPVVKARKWNVPGDFSSAAFWLVAAACREGAQVKIENVGLNPRRTAFLNVMKRMGANIDVKVTSASGDEAAGTITIKGGRLVGTEVGGAEIPNLIDELPVLTVAASFAEGNTVISDAEELRVKESDRIASMAKNLSILGIKAVEKKDGMIIEGGRQAKGGIVESYGDHRIAMSMAILALGAKSPIKIKGVGSIQTSYPEFWEHLRTVAGECFE